MRHGFRLLLDVPFTLGLRAGLRFLKFPFLLALKLFGSLAFHEVKVERSNVRQKQKFPISCLESLHFFQLRLQLVLILMALLLVGRVLPFKPNLFSA